MGTVEKALTEKMVLLAQLVAEQTRILDEGGLSDTTQITVLLSRISELQESAAALKFISENSELLTPKVEETAEVEAAPVVEPAPLEEQQAPITEVPETIAPAEITPDPEPNEAVVNEAAPEEVPEPTPEPAPTSVADTQEVESHFQDFGIEKNNSGREINENTTSEESLFDRFKKQPVTNLKTAIGLNERFQFTNELFNGDMEAFNRALEELNFMESYEDSQRLINLQLALRYNWQDENESVAAFRELVDRKFLAQ